MTKQRVLDIINDQCDNKGKVIIKGIVSAIGRANVDRNYSAGDPVPYNDNNNKMPEVGYCDSLAKVLFRTMDPKDGKPGAVYTSVIHKVADDKLYFSFPGKGKERDLNPKGLSLGQVNSLVNKLKTVEVNPMDLFFTMIQYRNNIMVDKLIKYIINHPPPTSPPSPFYQSLKALEKYHKLKREEKTTFYQQQKQNLLENEEFWDFVKEAIAIDNFNNIKGFLEGKSCSLVPCNKKVGEKSNYGVHVEAKGLYEAREKGEIKTGIFNVGLEKIVKKTEPSGCCAGCSAEFKALSEVHKGLIINRTNDLPYNFPPTNYQVSHNVKNDEVVLKTFSGIILHYAKAVNNGNQLNLDVQLQGAEEVIEEFCHF